MPGDSRRRTPGLRREEVAELAGISTDWYVRLEQGRCVQPSAATLAALAKALRLNKTEHAHLRALAQPTVRTTWARENVPAILQQVVRSLHQPAYVTGRRWDLLAWNAAAARVFAEFVGLPEAERTLLLCLFTNRPPAASSATPGRRKPGVSWRCSARPTTCGRTTPLSPSC